jgi:hypothetical protein
MIKVSGIKNGNRIPLPKGVPEIGTENWNSQPRLPLPQMGRSISADTIGQNKVTINLYCWWWQLLKEERWQKERWHKDGQQTTVIHRTIKQRSQKGAGELAVATMRTTMMVAAPAVATSNDNNRRCNGQDATTG